MINILLVEDYIKHEKLIALFEQTGTGQKKKSAFKRKKISMKFPQQLQQVDSRIQPSTSQQYPVYPVCSRSKIFQIKKKNYWT